MEEFWDKVKISSVIALMLPLFLTAGLLRSLEEEQAVPILSSALSVYAPPLQNLHLRPVFHD